MPLSDEENHILSQIERQFYEHDPVLAEQMATTTVYTDSMRRIKISIAGFLVGLVLILWSLASSTYLAAGGFAIMMLSALIFEHHLRKVGRAGLADLTSRIRKAQSDSGFRDRFRRDRE